MMFAGEKFVGLGEGPSEPEEKRNDDAAEK
jgi:hypothetical protein